MPRTSFTYTNNEITVVWKPDICIHSRICWTQMREVFDPAKRPWVNMSGSVTEKIIEQVRKCPSGALSYYMNEEMPSDKQETTITAESAVIANIEIQPNGPILVSSDCVIRHSNGEEEIKKGKTALCRCGASGNKPYCDGSHRKIDFRG
jgi:uncharacterized Fe-S cluster protein YjdI